MSVCQSSSRIVRMRVGGREKKRNVLVALEGWATVSGKCRIA